RRTGFPTLLAQFGVPAGPLDGRPRRDCRPRLGISPHVLAAVRTRNRDAGGRARGHWHHVGQVVEAGTRAVFVSCGVLSPHGTRTDRLRPVHHSGRAVPVHHRGRRGG